jgi:hypothetical protein
MLEKLESSKTHHPDALPIRDRIKGLRRERARELLPNPKTGADIPKLRPTLYRGCSPRLPTPMLCWSARCRTVAT